MLKCLRRFRAPSVTLRMGEESFEGRALLLEVCLGEFAGAGMRFAPEAVANDGQFEVLLIDEMKIHRALLSLAHLYNGRIDDHRAAHRWQCGCLSIAADAEYYLHCDGEVAGRLPVEIELLPNALSVMTPGVPPQLAQRAGKVEL